MDRWRNKVAVVTGASSGIGMATAKDLVNACFIVVGLARRLDRMVAIKDTLPVELQSKFFALKCDVSNEEDVKKSFSWIKKKLGGVDVLINNAATANFGPFLVSPDSSGSIEQILNTNLMGIVYCTREAFNSMQERNVAGHIFLINSVLGHKVWDFQTGKFPAANMYSPAKYAVTALTETYRQEFAAAGSKVKITDISPGFTDTEIISEEVKATFPTLKSEDVSSAILYVISTPPHVQIHSLMMKAIGETI